LQSDSFEFTTRSHFSTCHLTFPLGAIAVRPRLTLNPADTPNQSNSQLIPCLAVAQPHSISRRRSNLHFRRLLAVKAIPLQPAPFLGAISVNLGASHFISRSRNTSRPRHTKSNPAASSCHSNKFHINTRSQANSTQSISRSQANIPHAHLVPQLGGNFTAHTRSYLAANST